MTKTLLVVALESEFKNKSIHDIVYTGVGKVNAVSAVANYIIKHGKPDMIINYGTAGIVSNKDIVGTLVQPDVIVQRDMMAEPQAPRGITPFEETELAGTIMMNTNTNITLGTGDSFVMSQDPWFVYANVDLVDMEAYAIAKFSAIQDIEFKCYKYVSDFADEDAAKDWQQNVAKGQNLFDEILGII